MDRVKNKLLWVPVHSGAANHWYDCDVYSTFVADMANVGLFQPQPTQQQAPAQQERRHGNSWLSNTGGKWL